MKDYQESQFQVLEYHRKDEVVIDNVAKNENKNINLISLN